MSNRKPIKLHNHPMEGPVILVHARNQEGALDVGSAAHAFGPFPTEEAAMNFDESVDDDCYKVILDLFLPFGATLN